MNARIGRAFYIMKAFAILSVIAAHVTRDPSNIYIYISASDVVRVIWKWYGQIGVPVFLIIGGYLFHGSDGEKRTFWKKKFKRLIVPWMICGTMTYLLYVFRIRTFNALSWLKWVLGSGTWLYYATIYFCLLILFELFAICECQ